MSLFDYAGMCVLSSLLSTLVCHTNVTPQEPTKKSPKVRIGTGKCLVVPQDNAFI